MIKLLLRCTPDYKEGVTDLSLGISIGEKTFDKIATLMELGTGAKDNFLDFNGFDWPGNEPIELFAPKIKISDIYTYYLKDLPGNTLLSVKNEIEEYPCIDFIEISRDTISFRLYFNYLEWNHDWNIKFHIVEISKEIKSYTSDKLEGYKTSFEEEYSTIHIQFKNIQEYSIKELVEKYTPTVTKIYDDVIVNLTEKNIKYPFIATFNFPEHIKYECERYLSYFGQFLFDIGIDADTDIKKRRCEILFSVNPSNKNDAIEKIGQALALFLTFPTVKNNSFLLTSQEVDNQIKVQRLQAAVAHLHSELKLAEALVMAKNNHIYSLTEINSNIIALSLEKIVIQEKETEGISLFNDLVKIKKYKGKGFEIDIPKLVSTTMDMLKYFKE